MDQPKLALFVTCKIKMSLLLLILVQLLHIIKSTSDLKYTIQLTINYGFNDSTIIDHLENNNITLISANTTNNIYTLTDLEIKKQFKIEFEKVKANYKIDTNNLLDISINKDDITLNITGNITNITLIFIGEKIIEYKVELIVLKELNNQLKFENWLHNNAKNIFTNSINKLATENNDTLFSFINVDISFKSKPKFSFSVIIFGFFSFVLFFIIFIIFLYCFCGIAHAMSIDCRKNRRV